MELAPREALFAAIVAQLEGIKLSNGYRTDVDKVYRVDVLPDQFAPGEVSVLEVLESLTPERLTYLDNGPSGAYQSRIQIVISGCIKKGTTNLKSSDRHTAINNLLSDTVSALMQDPRFGGTAAKDSVISDPLAFVDSERPEALFNLLLTCNYVFSRAEL
jgi:hypothetical protein